MNESLQQDKCKLTLVSDYDDAIIFKGIVQ